MLLGLTERTSSSSASYSYSIHGYADELIGRRKRSGKAQLKSEAGADHTSLETLGTLFDGWIMTFIRDTVRDISSGSYMMIFMSHADHTQHMSAVRFYSGSFRIC